MTGGLLHLVQPTHQRPVYQSLYCSIIVRCSADVINMGINGLISGYKCRVFCSVVVVVLCAASWNEIDTCVERNLRHPMGSQPPGQTPLVVGLSSFFSAVRHKPVGIFWKLALTSTSDPIRPARLGPDHNRSTYLVQRKEVWHMVFWSITRRTTS